MTIRSFLTILQESRDWAASRRLGRREVIVTFIAPNSGFCGPSIRLKFLGYTDETKTIAKGVPAEGRYGLTLSQVERILEAFDVTLPEMYEFA